MCEANSNAVLDDVAKLLTEYTQYLYEFGYLYDDWIMEAPCPIHEFINKKFGKDLLMLVRWRRQNKNMNVANLKNLLY